MMPFPPIRCTLKQVLIFPALLVWAGCATPAPLPMPEESAHFYTRESGFHISAREGIIRFMVVLESPAPLEEPLFLELRYENPADPKAPHLEEAEWLAGADSLFLESPPLEGLETDKLYRVEIDVFTGADREEVADRHEVLILSSIDTRRHGR